MEKNKSLVVSKSLNVVLIVEIVCMLYLILMLVCKLEPQVKAKVNGIQLESMEYRGAKLYWEKGNPMPQERLEIFCTVMDSLSDDVNEKYSLENNPTDFFYLTAEEYYWGDLTFGHGFKADAFQTGGEVFLGPTLVDSTNDSVLTNLKQFRYGPWKRFDDNQVYDDGYFAMVLIHEYVHAVQYNHPGYLSEYAVNVGWQGDNKPEEDENFYSVLSPYSLENPSEDMSETLMYSYLCGNNLGVLSEVRLQYIEDFWAIPREEYCRNFH